jgi:hypothetical protein
MGLPGSDDTWQQNATVAQINLAEFRQDLVSELLPGSLRKRIEEGLTDSFCFIFLNP